MTANIITVIAVVAGIAWLGMLFVSAIRNRGGEEIAPNLRPGITDEQMETRRLEGGQKAAIVFSAFLAVSLPLYFLGEQSRQEGFVEEFSTASIDRGEALVVEFACFSCHGPEGSGGVAPSVEKRSGVTVNWVAPSINDVFFRYDRDEINYWVTYGRGNTPMPGWGLDGGGPLNEAEVVDVVNYLETIQISQAEALNEVDPATNEALGNLEGADATVEQAIVRQEQVVADIMAADDQVGDAVRLAEAARAILDGAATGIDTDADGLSDVAETELTAISAEAMATFTVVEPVALDPATADAELAADALARLEAAVEGDPIVGSSLAEVSAAIEGGAVDPSVGISFDALVALEELSSTAADLGVDVPVSIESAADAEDLLAALEDAAAAEEPVAGASELAGEVTAAIAEGSDTDGDGLSDGAEETITNQMAAANAATLPSALQAVALDPANPASVGGEPDITTANAFVGGLESLATNLTVTTENQSRLLAQEQGGLEYLRSALEEKAYAIDFAGVAEAMGASEEDAARAVGLFNANCARCHTAGFSAGIPFTREAGSGGFGPALWDGRPLVQFGAAPEDPAQEDDLLVQFLINGSEEQTPYGLNGFGSGRMPAFGAILSQADIELLAKYLRSGNLDGKGDTADVLP